MTTRTITKERIPATDLRLKRHVLHDSESRRYAFNTAGLRIVSVEHQRILPILDQLDVGSCTADCGLTVLGTEPYYSAALATLVTKAFGSFDQAGAYRLYSAEETLQGSGTWPPVDVGSSGLTLAKTLRAAGLISGWTQTFSLPDALKALVLYPLNSGTIWLNSMFTPNAEGIITVDFGSGIAGGHEYEIVGYDAARDLMKIANSWGPAWGKDGYGYIPTEAWGQLLAQQGDVTIFTPLDQPAPVPTPVPLDSGDLVFARALRENGWVTKRHMGDNRRVATAARAWLTMHGFPISQTTRYWG